MDWKALILPFWRRAPLRVRRWLIWQGASKFTVGVAAVCLNPQGQMLLLEHRFHNENPWGFPGGWVDRGESPLQGIVREVREETGLEATVQGVLSVTGDGEWVEIFYLCHVPDEPPVIQASEATGYCWVEPHACTLSLMPTQRRALQVARALIAGEPHPHYPMAGANLAPFGPSPPT